MRKCVIIFLLAEIFSSSMAQEKSRAVTLSGYITTMQSVMFDSLSGPFINDNLLHNRLNVKGYINENLTFAAEFRNRLFTGDMVKFGSAYSDIIGSDPGVVDMSWNIIRKRSFLLNTTV